MDIRDFTPFFAALIIATAAAVGVELTESEVAPVVAGIIALLLAVYAAWQRGQTQAKVAALAASAKTNSNLNNQVNALTTPDQVKPGVIETLPSRAWKMNEETKKWLCSGMFAPFCPGILAQIKAAEDNHQVHYFVNTGLQGIQYEIEYGLLKQQIGNPV